jgi:lysyl-tRNA synthetase class 2
VRAAAAALERAGVATRASRWPAAFERCTVDEAFRRHAGWEPSVAWDADRFFRDLVDRVEPPLREQGAVFLHDFPAPVASLARLSPADTRVAERCELYLDGLEICNGFSELTDHREQRARFERANGERRALGKEPYPVDERFLEALECGIPECAGNALGVDRLLMALAGAGSIGEVTAFSG